MSIDICNYILFLFVFYPKPNNKNVIAVKIILRCFGLAFDLKVNCAKNRISGVGVGNSMLESYVSVLNCDIMRI